MLTRSNRVVCHAIAELIYVIYLGPIRAHGDASVDPDTPHPPPPTSVANVNLAADVMSGSLLTVSEAHVHPAGVVL